jgi:hypothetical protein
MSLTTYCEFDEVRSALGVNSLELSDRVLSLPVYEMGLIREFNRVSTSLAAAFSSVIAKASSARTDAEKALYDAVHLFAVYAVARQVGVALPNFTPKDVGDGKANLSRFAGEPFTKVLDAVGEYYQAMKENVRQALEVYAGSSSTTAPSLIPATVFKASGRLYDPVTG